MHIRPMFADDVPTLARLMATDPLWQRYGVTESSAVTRLNAGLAADATLAVAEIEGVAVGFIWYVRSGAFDRSGYIKLIGVARTVRGQGVGRALLAYAEAALFAQSSDVFLLVSDFNHSAQAFYRQLGYVLIGSVPDYIMPGITELLFRKRRGS